MFNYEGGNSVAAHVIGHKEIRINNTTDINLIGENDNNGDITGTLSGDSIFDSSTNSSNGVSSPTLYNTSLGISDTVILNADSTENETDNTRQLVVVAVRGSVTPEDWAMDVLTQVHIDLLDFEAGRDMVLKSLYGYKDECEECSGLTTSRRENDYFLFPNPSSRLRRATSFAKGG